MVWKLPLPDTYPDTDAFVLQKRFVRVRCIKRIQIYAIRGK